MFYLSLILLVILVILNPIKWYIYWRKKGIPYKITVPYVGIMWDIITKKRSISEVVRELYWTYPDKRYFAFDFMGLPTVCLRDPELIKQMCVKDYDHFLNHNGFMNFENEVLWSKSLFNLRDQKWKEMRSVLSPSFTSSKIKTMFKLISECSQRFVDYFLNETGNLIEVDLKDAYSRFTIDVIASAAFGFQLNSLEDRENEFFIKGRHMHDIKGVWNNIKIALLTLTPKIAKFLDIHFMDPNTTEYFKNVIKKSILYRENNNIVRQDMLHLLIEARKGGVEEKEVAEETGFAAVKEHLKGQQIHNGEKMSIDEITSQAFIFFVAGFDTVTTQMCFISYELAVNPDIQERLIQEIDKCRNDNAELTYESLAKLTYLDMVVSETMRKYPTFAATDRRCTKPYTIQPTGNENKSFLNTNDSIWIPIFGLHRDPQYYPNPEKFDPERFSPENKGNINPYTYFPFGVGPRNCIGSRFALIEIKALLYHILSHFEIVPIEKSAIPVKLSKGVLGLDAEGGFHFGLKKRIRINRS